MKLVVEVELPDLELETLEWVRSLLETAQEQGKVTKATIVGAPKKMELKL